MLAEIVPQTITLKSYPVLVMIITNETGFLHTDSEENPESRVFMEACLLVCRFLLFFTAVCLCNDGTFG